MTEHAFPGADGDNHVRLLTDASGWTRLSVGDRHASLGATLSPEDGEALAFTILAQYFDIAHDFDGEGTTALTRNLVEPKVGDFYRFISSPAMDTRWRGNPIVKVTHVGPRRFEVSSHGGVTTDIRRESWRDYLTGPIKVKEVVTKTWALADKVDGEPADFPI
jgi:hypothetical protein